MKISSKCDVYQVSFRKYLKAFIVACIWMGLCCPAVFAQEKTRINARISSGFILGVDPKDALQTAQVLGDIVTKKLSKQWKPVSFDIELSSSVKELADEINSSEVDIAYVTAFEYCQLQKKTDIVPVVQHVMTGGVTTHKACLIARKDIKADSIADLKGKSFAYFSEESVDAYLYPQWLLAKRNLPDISKFFGNLMHVTKEKSALYAVAFGKVDSASVSLQLVDMLRELSPAMANRIRVVETSESFPGSVLIASKRLDDEGLRHIRSVMINEVKSTDERIKQTLTLWKFERFQELNKSDFEGVESMIEIIESHRKKHICPICGKSLSNEDVKASHKHETQAVHFCSKKCYEKYKEHYRKALSNSEKSFYIVGFVMERFEGRNPQDAMCVVSKLIRDLGDKLGFELAVELVPSEKLVIERLKEKSIAFLTLSAVNYVNLSDKGYVKPMVRYVKHQDEFRTMLTVNKESGIKDINGLKGKSVAVCSPIMGETELFLKTLVYGVENHKDPKDFFGAIVTCPSEKSALRSVQFGQVDCACVRDTTYNLCREMQPGAVKKLEVVVKSEDFLLGPLSYREGLSKDIVDRVTEYMLNLHEQEIGKETLTFFGVRRSILAADSDYDGIRRMMKKIKPPEE